MSKTTGTILLGIAIILSSTAFAGDLDFNPNEVIVKYKPGILRSRAASNKLYDSVGVKNVKRFTGVGAGMEQLELDGTTSIENAIRTLQDQKAIAYAQPNYIIRIIDAVSDETMPTQNPASYCWIPGSSLLNPGCKKVQGDDFESEREIIEEEVMNTRPAINPVPNEVFPPIEDPNVDKTWGMEKIGATQAWKTWSGSKDFIVANIDTGIDYNHQDLAFNLWKNPKPSAENDVIGYDFIHNDNLPFDDNLHGTHTAGTIGAVGGNGLGVSGVSPHVSIMTIKAFGGEGQGSTSDAIRGIDYAINHGAKILNNSWGGRTPYVDTALKDAVDRAKDKGALFVVAAGNDSYDNDEPMPSYPAAFDSDNLIAVASVDSNDDLAKTSNYGQKTTHLAAPGVKIFSTVPGSDYKYLSGTSMASPHVAGAAALLWSKHPDWNYKKVKEVLMSSVDPVASLADKTISGGRLNVLKALSSN